MALRIVLGRAGSGKSSLCREEIRQRLLAEPDGPALIWLLPEHATFRAERELAGAEGLTGFSRAFVFGFRRLAQKVLLETGGALRPQLSDLGKKLLLSRIMRQQQDKLHVFRQAAEQKSFAETLAGMLKEFKTYSLSPAALNEAAQQLADSPLKDKMKDLALIYQQFEQALANEYIDPEDYLYVLAGKLTQSALVASAEIWLDGFSWFNPREEAVLVELLQCAANITVTLCLDDPHDAQHQQETGLFHRQWHTWRRLHALAAMAGVACQDVILPGTQRFAQRPLLAHIEAQFFQFPAKRWQQSREGLVLAEAVNRRVEVEAIARDMLRLCREEGLRWKDMAVLLRDSEAYGPLLAAVLTDYDIPFFSDQRRLSVHHPLAELIRSVLEICLQSWSYDAVFRALKTDFFSLTREEIDVLENYVLEFGIRGSHWARAERWEFCRRLSLAEDEEINERQQQRLTTVHAARQKVTTPLLNLLDSLQQAADATAITTVLYLFLEELAVPERLTAWADAAEAAGELEAAREHRQIWAAIVDLLEQMVESLGQETISLAEYAEILGDGLDSVTFSLIPPGLDHVTIASLDQNTVDNIHAIYIPGVNDGVLPQRGRSEGLITDHDRTVLAAMGVQLAPGAAADTFAERFSIYTALTRATGQLWLSYPLAADDGSGLLPSLVISRLRELAGGAGIRYLPLEPPPGEEAAYLTHPRRSLSLLAASLRRYKDGESISTAWWDLYNWLLQQPDYRLATERALAGLFHDNRSYTIAPAMAQSLYSRGGRLRGSVTRFESFRSCPFKHFAQYGLKLQERPVFRLAAPDMGQFLHAALKAFGDGLAQEQRPWGSVQPNECNERCRQIVEQLAPRLQNEILLSSEQNQHVLQRLTATIQQTVWRLIEFDRVSSFKPVALEKSFGRGQADSLPSLVYPLASGLCLELIGQIDRLDYVKHQETGYLLVIDYKSGGAWLTLTEVYHGLKLQLLTYLLVAARECAGLTGDTTCEPAGVLYYFLRSPAAVGDGPLSEGEIIKKLNGQLKMPGWIVADPDIVKLLDASIAGYSEFLKVALKKDGSFYSTAAPYIRTAEEFTALLAHVEHVLTDTAEQIMAGHTEIAPYWLAKKTPCSYCPYGAVCQFDQLLPENTYSRLALQSDEDVWQKLKAEEGTR